MPHEKHAEKRYQETLSKSSSRLDLGVFTLLHLLVSLSSRLPTSLAPIIPSPPLHSSSSSSTASISLSVPLSTCLSPPPSTVTRVVTHISLSTSSLPLATSSLHPRLFVSLQCVATLCDPPRSSMSLPSLRAVATSAQDTEETRLAIGARQLLHRGEQIAIIATDDAFDPEVLPLWRIRQLCDQSIFIHRPLAELVATSYLPQQLVAMPDSTSVQAGMRRLLPPRCSEEELSRVSIEALYSAWRTSVDSPDDTALSMAVRLLILVEWAERCRITGQGRKAATALVQLLSQGSNVEAPPKQVPFSWTLVPSFLLTRLLSTLLAITKTLAMWTQAECLGRRLHELASLYVQVDQSSHMTMLMQLADIRLKSGRTDDGLSVAHQLLHLAESCSDAKHIAIGHKLIADAYQLLGEYRTALHHYELRKEMDSRRLYPGEGQRLVDLINPNPKELHDRGVGLLCSALSNVYLGLGCYHLSLRLCLLFFHTTLRTADKGGSAVAAGQAGATLLQWGTEQSSKYKLDLADLLLDLQYDLALSTGEVHQRCVALTKQIWAAILLRKQPTALHRIRDLLHLSQAINDRGAEREAHRLQAVAYTHWLRDLQQRAPHSTHVIGFATSDGGAPPALGQPLASLLGILGVTEEQLKGVSPQVPAAIHDVPPDELWSLALHALGRAYSGATTMESIRVSEELCELLLLRATWMRHAGEEEGTGGGGGRLLRLAMDELHRCMCILNERRQLLESEKKRMAFQHHFVHCAALAEEVQVANHDYTEALLLAERYRAVELRTHLAAQVQRLEQRPATAAAADAAAQSLVMDLPSIRRSVRGLAHPLLFYSLRVRHEVEYLRMWLIPTDDKEVLFHQSACAVKSLHSIHTLAQIWEQQLPHITANGLFTRDAFVPAREEDELLQRLESRFIDARQQYDLPAVTMAEKRPNTKGVAKGSSATASNQRGHSHAVGNATPLVGSTVGGDRHPSWWVLRALYDRLIAPLASAVQAAAQAGSKLYIVPHSRLYELPFTLLLDEMDQTLIERMELSLLPSIAVGHLLLDVRRFKSRMATQARNVVLVANALPIPPSLKLPPVEKAEDEVATIADLIRRAPEAGLPSLRSVLKTGTEATRQAVEGALTADCLVAHFATHGFRQLQHMLVEGSDSALLLSGELWTVHQMREAKPWLNGCLLAVLSSCHSGHGSVVEDGVLDMSRAFLTMGVPHVVVSLWAVCDSAETVQLVRGFYESLLKQRLSASPLPSPTAALRQALCTQLRAYRTRGMFNLVDVGGFTCVGL